MWCKRKINLKEQRKSNYCNIIRRLILLEINDIEKTKQTNANKKFIAYFGFLFFLVFLFVFANILNNNIDFSALNPTFFDIAILLLTISATMTLLVNIVYISPLIYHLIKKMAKKDFSQMKNEFEVIVNEQKKPTKRSYKIRRVLIWIFSISALVSLVTYVTYLFVLVSST